MLFIYYLYWHNFVGRHLLKLILAKACLRKKKSDMEIDMFVELLSADCCNCIQLQYFYKNVTFLCNNTKIKSYLAFFFVLRSYAAKRFGTLYDGRKSCRKWQTTSMTLTISLQLIDFLPSAPGLGPILPCSARHTFRDTNENISAELPQRSIHDVEA